MYNKKSNAKKNKNKKTYVLYRKISLAIAFKHKLCVQELLLASYSERLLLIIQKLLINLYNNTNKHKLQVHFYKLLKSIKYS